MSASRLARGLRLGGALVIVTVALTRCVIFFAPRVVFDVDPAFDPQTLAGFGPAGSLWLDVVLLLACAAALLGETLAGRGLDWRLLLLAAIPLPAVLYQGVLDAGNLWRGATWATAAIAAVSIAHGARDPALRNVVLAILLAVLAPLLARGAANVTYEHADNIELFESRKDAILRDRGWEPGSPYALIFERRVRHRQPGGWFVTTNIYGALMAFGAAAGLGLTIGSARARLPSGWTGLVGLLTTGCVAALAMTGSKGAIGAGAAGMLVVGAATLVPAGARVARRYGPALTIACVVAALGAVAARGLVLPESFAGDRSLLFRWHYAVSSASIIAEHPIAGVGPDRFQEAYVRHRVPRNPEEVASAHSTFVDWVATLGFSGAAWIGLTLLLLRRAATARDDPDGDAAGDDDAKDVGGAQIGAILVGAGGLFVGMLVEWRVLDPMALLVRGLGAGAFVFVAVTLMRVLGRGAADAITWGLAGGALVLVVHGQIEMTFTQPGAVVWLMVVLGAIAGARGPTSGATPGATISASGGGAPVAAVLAVLALWLAVTGAMPVSRQAMRLREAAAALRPLAVADPRPPVNEMIDRRRRAATLLLEADAIMPTMRWPKVAAAEQLQRAANDAPAALRRELHRESLTLAESAIADGARPDATVLAVFLHRALGDRPAAIELQRSLAAADPNGLFTHKRLADLLWETGEREEARDVYRRTLEINEAFDLDPLKQLGGDDLETVERRAE